MTSAAAAVGDQGERSQLTGAARGQREQEADCADAVLLNLGYPADAVRKMRYGQALGTELAAGSIQSDLSALVQVVGHMLDRTIRELASDGWEDKAYMLYFL
jgi:hypothetical protein